VILRLEAEPHSRNYILLNKGFFFGWIVFGVFILECIFLFFLYYAMKVVCVDIQH
jgi:hypothetical protein